MENFKGLRPYSFSYSRETELTALIISSSISFVSDLLDPGNMAILPVNPPLSGASKNLHFISPDIKSAVLTIKRKIERLKTGYLSFITYFVKGRNKLSRKILNTILNLSEGQSYHFFFKTFCLRA